MLKRVCHEIFDLHFLHDSNSAGPLITVFSHFRENEKFAKPFSPVHMGPRSNLWSQKNWSKIYWHCPFKPKRRLLHPWIGRTESMWREGEQQSRWPKSTAAPTGCWSAATRCGRSRWTRRWRSLAGTTWSLTWAACMAPKAAEPPKRGRPRMASVASMASASLAAKPGGPVSV